MNFVSVKLMNIKTIFFSAAIVVFHLMVYRYVLQNPLDQVDLNVLNNRCIAIDAGHGGIDNGASWNGLEEKNINLLVAEKLSLILKDHKAIVFMTRDDDTDYYTKGKGGKRKDLLTRVKFIEDSHAELFISIHMNASRDRRWSGAQAFYSPKFEANKRLAEIMQIALAEFPRENKRQAKANKDILILNATSVPGVLVEAGFISNPHEATLLANKDYQEKMAMQIAKAIAYYLSHN